MSATDKLSSCYGTLFNKTAEFAISPYTSLFMRIANKDKGDMYAGLFLGFAACAALTVVPVLPVCTVLTCALSLGAAVLAAASALLTYPVALGIDAVSACLDKDSSGPAYSAL